MRSVNGTAAAGTQFIVEGLDGDGDLDVAAAGNRRAFAREPEGEQRAQSAARERAFTRQELAVPGRRHNHAAQVNQRACPLL